MDGMRDKAGSSINQTHVIRASGRSIWISASRGDGIRGQGESGRSGAVGVKSDSKAGLSGNGCSGR